MLGTYQQESKDLLAVLGGRGSCKEMLEWMYSCTCFSLLLEMSNENQLLSFEVTFLILCLIYQYSVMETFKKSFTHQEHILQVLNRKHMKNP